MRGVWFTVNRWHIEHPLAVAGNQIHFSKFTLNPRADGPAVFSLPCKSGADARFPQPVAASDAVHRQADAVDDDGAL